MHSNTWLVGLLSLTLAAACGGNSTPEPQTADTPPAETSAPTYTQIPEPTAAPRQPEAEATPPAPPPSNQPVTEPPRQPLTDGQIAAITDVTNASEVDQAMVAQRRAKNPRVKKFAAMMIAHHSQARKQQVELLKRLAISATENPRSAAIAEESSRTVESLKTLSQPEFDRAYIGMQVDAHQKVLDAFDNELIPDIKNEYFKASLVEFRPRIEAHLHEAQDIQQELEAKPQNPMGSSEQKADPVAVAPHGK